MERWRDLIKKAAMGNIDWVRFRKTLAATIDPATLRRALEEATDKEYNRALKPEGIATAISMATNHGAAGHCLIFIIGVHAVWDRYGEPIEQTLRAKLNHFDAQGGILDLPMWIVDEMTYRGRVALDEALAIGDAR